MKPLPVTVLTGFLGSGKTTLLNRLLKERPGVCFGVVVNEFGAASLESQLVESRRRPLFELPSGCLCCVSDGDLEAALKAVRQKDPSIGHILVEASGLSSPGPLLGVLTRGEEYELGGVFGVVDAVRFLKDEGDYPAVRRQLAFADAVFLTKTDLAPAGAVRDRLGAVRPGVRVFDTAGRIPWATLFEGAEADAEKPGTPARRFFQGGKHHDADVLEFESAAPLNLDRLAEVFASLDPGVLRAKGVLHLDDPTAARFKYIVQYTGAQKQLYSRRWEADEPHQSALVFLGSFDTAALKQRLEQCAAP